MYLYVVISFSKKPFKKPGSYHIKGLGLLKHVIGTESRHWRPSKKNKAGVECNMCCSMWAIHRISVSSLWTWKSLGNRLACWVGWPVSPRWPFCHSSQVQKAKRTSQKPETKREGLVINQTHFPKFMYAHSKSASFAWEMERIPTEKAWQPKSLYVLILTYTYLYVFGQNLLIRSYTYLYVFILFKMNGKTCHYPAQSAEKLFVFFFKSGPKWLKMTGEVSRDPWHQQKMAIYA